MSKTTMFNQGVTPPTPDLGWTTFGFDAVTKRLLSVDDQGKRTDYGTESPQGELVGVASLADLPNPVGGVITLVPGKIYEFRKGFDFGTLTMISTGAAVRGVGSPAISTFSTSPFITSTSGPVIIEDIQLTNPAGPAFDLTAGSDLIFLRGVLCVAQQSIVRGASVCLMHLCTWAGIGGLRVTGAYGQALWFVGSYTNLAPGQTALKIDPGSTFDIFDIRGTAIEAKAGQVGIDIPVGVTPTELAQVSGNLLFGDGELVKVGGVGPATLGWRWLSNGAVVQDSATSGDISMSNNTTATPITVQNQWEQITIGAPAVWAQGPESERFKLTGTDEIEHEGMSTQKMQIFYGVTAEAASGTSRAYEFRVEQNTGSGWAEVPGSIAPLDYRSAPVRTSKVALYTMVENERLRLTVRNVGVDNTDVIVNTAFLLVSQSG